MSNLAAYIQVSKNRQRRPQRCTSACAHTPVYTALDAAKLPQRMLHPHKSKGHSQPPCPPLTQACAQRMHAGTQALSACMQTHKRARNHKPASTSKCKYTSASSIERAQRTHMGSPIVKESIPTHLHDGVACGAARVLVHSGNTVSTQLAHRPALQQVQRLRHARAHHGGGGGRGLVANAAQSSNKPEAHTCETASEARACAQHGGATFAQRREAFKTSQARVWGASAHRHNGTAFRKRSTWHLSGAVPVAGRLLCAAEQALSEEDALQCI